MDFWIVTYWNNDEVTQEELLEAETGHAAEMQFTKNFAGLYCHIFSIVKI